MTTHDLTIPVAILLGAAALIAEFRYGRFRLALVLGFTGLLLATLAYLQVTSEPEPYDIPPPPVMMGGGRP